MKKILLFLILLLPLTQLEAQSTETFETEAVGSSTFTDNGKVFTITSVAPTFFDVFNYTGAGWNGFSADNRFIDNSGSTYFDSPVEFAISSSSAFKLKSLYLFLSQSNFTLNVTGSLTIIGKLGGVEQFTTTVNSPFNTSRAVNNGYTFINMTNFGGVNNSNTPIDQYVIKTSGNIAYVSLDAMTWDVVPVCEVPANITTSGVTQNKASINWTNTGTFDIEWGLSGYTQGGAGRLGNQNGISALSYEITGLSANTQYDVYIRKNCSVNQSTWEKKTITTLGCTTPAPTATNATVTAGAASATLGASTTATGNTVTETIDLGNTFVPAGLGIFVELNGTVNGIPSGATITSAKLIFNGVTTGGIGAVWVKHFPVSVSGTATTLSETTLTNSSGGATNGSYNINLPNNLLNGTFTVKIINNNSGGFGYLTINSVKLEYTYTLPVTINWYDVATGGTALATGTTYEVTNTTQLNTAGTYTYYVTADNGTCESERTAVTLTVNPAVTMDQPANQEVRHGDNTEAVTFTSAEASVTYDWTNSTTSIGLPASGTGNIPSFVANNTTDTAVTATITVTPKIVTESIVDIDQPMADQYISSFSIPLAQSFKAVSNSISGAGILLYSEVGNSTVTIELWDKLPNQTGAIKLATGSSSAVPNSWVDVSWSPVTVTPGTTYYLVFTSTDINNVLLGHGNNPYEDGQIYAFSDYFSYPDYDFTFRVYKAGATITGTPKTFTIKVNPGLTMDQPTNQEVRHGDNTEAVTFTSTEAGVTYDWTNNTTSIGLPASGTGNIFSFVANNTTDKAVTATITVTPKIVTESIVDIDQPMADQQISSFSIPLAQSFTAVSNSISGAGIKLSAAGAISTVTVELWDKLPNQTGAIKLATGSSTATPNSWVDVSWSPVLVTPGTTYYLVFNSTDEGNGMMGSFDTYADGQVYAWPEYYSYPDYDFTFRVYKAGATITGTPKTFTIKVNPLTLDVSDINKKGIKVYPNPFADVINFSDIENIESITVNDVSGKLIKTVKPTKEISFSNNPSGVYIINVTFKDGDTKSFKVIKK